MPAVPRKSSTFSGRFTNGLNRLLVKLKVDDVPHIKRIVVTVVGGTIVIFGVILIVTPGPAVLVIPVGLAILGTEYAWARRWLRKARVMAQTAINKTQEPWARRWIRRFRRLGRRMMDKAWNLFRPPGETARPPVASPRRRDSAEAPGRELVGSAGGEKNGRAV